MVEEMWSSFSSAFDNQLILPVSPAAEASKPSLTSAEARSDLELAQLNVSNSNTKNSIPTRSYFSLSWIWVSQKAFRLATARGVPERCTAKRQGPYAAGQREGKTLGVEMNKTQWPNLLMDDPCCCQEQPGELRGEAAQHPASFLAGYHHADQLLLSYAHPRTPDITSLLLCRDCLHLHNESTTHKTFQLLHVPAACHNPLINSRWEELKVTSLEKKCYPNLPSKSNLQQNRTAEPQLQMPLTLLELVHLPNNPVQYSPPRRSASSTLLIIFKTRLDKTVEDTSSEQSHTSCKAGLDVLKSLLPGWSYSHTCA